MSYILEALKKSEQERKLGDLPDLAAPQVASESKIPPWLWPLVASFGVVVLLLAGLLWQQMRSQTPPVIDAEAVVSTAPLPPRDPVAVPAKPSAAEIKPISADPVLPEPPVVASEDVAALQPLPGLVQPSPLRDTGKKSPGKAQADEPVVAPAVAKPVVEEVRLWRELPHAERHGLPGLRLDVHAYSEDEVRRFVLVNMRKYRQGDKLREGPVLEAITTDGAVLHYKGTRFKILRQ